MCRQLAGMERKAVGQSAQIGWGLICGNLSRGCLALRLNRRPSIRKRNRGLPTERFATLVPRDEFRDIIEQLPPDLAREARNMTRDEFLAFITDPFWAEIAVQPQAA